MHDNDELHKRLESLGQKINAIKEHEAFEEHFDNGNVPSREDLDRHYKEAQEKLQSDLHDHEEKHGHLNMLERQIIIWANALEG